MRPLQQLCQRLRPGDLLQGVHPLRVVPSIGLHLGDSLAACLELLGQQQHPRVLQRGLDHRDHVEGVVRGGRVEGLYHRQREGR